LPEPLTLDPRRTALVLIDLQKGIVARPLAPYDGAHVVQNGVRLGRRCNDLGAPVVLVHVTFAESGVDRLQQPADSPTPVPQGGYPADWADFVPEVAQLQADVVITKRQWSAFHGTELDLQLRRRGIDTIILGGIATSYGVESTAREAWQHNYSVVVAEDACSSMDSEMHRFSVEKIFPRLSRVRSTASILEALRAP